jgi:hypothetical protein
MTDHHNYHEDGLEVALQLHAGSSSSNSWPRLRRAMADLGRYGHTNCTYLIWRGVGPAMVSTSIRASLAGDYYTVKSIEWQH